LAPRRDFGWLWRDPITVLRSDVVHVAHARDSLLIALGFEPGDTVLAINGVSLIGSEAQRALQQARSASAWQARIIRRGSAMTLDYVAP